MKELEKDEGRVRDKLDVIVKRKKRHGNITFRPKGSQYAAVNTRQN